MAAIVQDKYEKGCYYVDGQTWQVGVRAWRGGRGSCCVADRTPSAVLLCAHTQVGTRYTLLKTLGSGSFSSVVAALDNDTGEKVGMASEGQQQASR